MQDENSYSRRLKKGMGELRGRLRTKWAFASETQRDHMRILAGALILGMVGLLGYWVGKPLWRRWQRREAVRQAQEFAQKRDYRDALLAMRRAASYDMSDFNVWKQVATFLSDIDSPEALVARKNLVILAPSDLSLRLSYVMDALRFGEVESAREMIASVAKGQQRDLEYFRMAAAFAYATGMYDQMEEALAAIVARNPSDWEARFNLASLQLWGPDSARAAKAKQTLLELTKVPAARVRASIELLKYTSATGTRSEIADLVPLLAERNSGHPLERRTGDTLGALPPGWQTLLTAFETNAGGNSADAAMLARWMASVGLLPESLVWIDTLGKAVRSDPVLRIAELDLALRADGIDRVRKLIVGGDWIGMDSSTLDLALAARWQQHNQSEQHARLTWTDATTSANGALPVLRMLVRLAGVWAMPDEKEITLRAIIDRAPGERWAYEALRGAYLQKGDTDRLWQLYRSWLGREPSNKQVGQSWVMLSILTDKVDAQVNDEADALWKRFPGDPAVAVCLAASLRLRGHRAEGAEILESLSPQAKDLPRVALWRGLLLAEIGRKALARDALSHVDPSRLIEEEKRIWRLAASLCGMESQNSTDAQP